MRFGPYAAVYQPEPPPPPRFSAPQAPRVRRPPPPPEPEADVTVKSAANSNTVETAPIVPPPPPLPDARPATVVTIPRAASPRTQEDDEAAAQPMWPEARPEARASVTLRRETATFTVPVSEAVIPASLKAALGASRKTWTPVHGRSEAVDILDTEESPGDRLDAFEAPAAGHDPLSDDDRAFIRRIAPPAAE
jgi:hypothetical protein